MTPRLRIPSAYRPGLQKLLNLDEKTVEELLDALEGERATVNDDDLVAQVVSKVGDDHKDDIRDVMDLLIALYSVRASVDTPIPNFVEAIIDDGNVEIPDQNKTDFAERLNTLLNIDVLNVSTKAADVMHEHAHNLRDARILTDIRPVFGDDVEIGPAGALLVHTLRIRYYQGPDLAEFFVALTPSDLSDLRDIIERADRKTLRLQGVLDAAEVPNLSAHKE